MITTYSSTASRGHVAETRRLMNDSIAKGAERFGDSAMHFDFFCECGDLSCHKTIRLTVADYRHRRNAPLTSHDT